MAESTTQTAGAEARVNEQALVAARGEAVKLERERIVEIEHRATRFKSILGDDFVRKAISDGKTADQFSVEAFAAHLLAASFDPCVPFTIGLPRDERQPASPEHALHA